MDGWMEEMTDWRYSVVSRLVWDGWRGGHIEWLHTQKVFYIWYNEYTYQVYRWSVRAFPRKVSEKQNQDGCIGAHNESRIGFQTGKVTKHDMWKLCIKYELHLPRHSQRITQKPYIYIKDKQNGHIACRIRPKTKDLQRLTQ